MYKFRISELFCVMKDYAKLMKRASVSLGKGDLKRAEKDSRMLLKISPNDENALVLHGIVNLMQEKFSKAIKLFDQALEKNSKNPDALCNLGSAYNKEGKFEEAKKFLSLLLDGEPNHAEGLNNYGSALFGMGKEEENGENYFSEAVLFFKKAISANTEYAIAYKNLGNSYYELKKYEEASRQLRISLSLDPGNSVARTDLIRALLRGAQVKDAIACCSEKDSESAKKSVSKELESLITYDIKVMEFESAEHYLEIFKQHFPENPRLNYLHISLFTESLEKERYDDWFNRTDRPVLEPSSSSSYYMGKLYEYPITAQKIERLTSELRETRDVHPILDTGYRDYRSRETGSRFRLGIFSGDFFSHSVARFVDAIFEHLNREKFELKVYSFTPQDYKDKTTAELKKRADTWREVKDLSDDECAEQINRDNLDAILDLSGHSAPNRAEVLIRKPARNQISWIGFPATTGFKSIDYIIGDDITIQPMDEKFYTEKILRLPTTSLCYTPTERELGTSVGPFTKSDNFRFVSLNNLLKVNMDVLKAWASILERVPNSELSIKDKRMHSRSMQEKLFSWFESQGIRRDRITLLERMSDEEHLSFLGKSHLALDTFPYNGTTTSCEALFMGLPTLTLSLPGPMVSRQGELVNTTVGYTELITYTINEYIERAVELSSETERLAEMRHVARRNMTESPLCDGPKLCQNLEELLLSL